MFCDNGHEKPQQNCIYCVTAERDALKAACRNAYAFLEGYDSVALDGKTLTDNRWIQALNVTETRVEVPRE